MTKSEFDKLTIGDRVKSSDGTLYLVYDDDSFGPPNKVCELKSADSTNQKYARISNGNYQFWKLIILS